MRINTGFYFVNWLFKRMCRTLFQLPLKIHHSYMNVYQDHRGLGLVAWFITSLLLVFSIAIIGLMMGDTQAESVRNFKTIVPIGWIVAVTYFITCVILDQYEKFENERKRTWHTLKD